MEIRPERNGDIAAIRALNQAAFDGDTEANIVDLLRVRARPIVSLVALDAGSIVGHILFSPVTLSGHEDLVMMGLAPMAVLPAHQRRGIGSSLVRAGLDRCVRLPCSAVVVVGHPEYYPRFGFVPASRFALGCEYDVADDVFMAVELEPGSLRGRSGTIRYHEAFAQADPE
jgi:putative acetyltransferase